MDDDASGEIEFAEFLKVRAPARPAARAARRAPTAPPHARSRQPRQPHTSTNAKVIENQKASAAQANDETDTIEAFVALGGNPDKSGEISTDKLKAVITEFQLTIDIDRLIAETDKDGSGQIDYEEFKCVAREKKTQMLKSPPPRRANRVLTETKRPTNTDRAMMA